MPPIQKAIILLVLENVSSLIDINNILNIIFIEVSRLTPFDASLR